MRICGPDTTNLTLVERYDERASLYWDKFYGSNETRFYKDRHYLQRECPHLLTPDISILEVRSVLCSLILCVCTSGSLPFAG